MDNEHISDLDRLLDRALAAYAPVPLRLEARVLEHVIRAESRRRRRRVYALGTLVLAASLLGFFVRQKPVLPPSPKLYVASMKVKGESRPPSWPLLQRVVHRKRSKRTQQPLKGSVFPSPTPMTSEERALVRFVQRSPQAAADAFADSGKESSQSLQIEALKIVPLADEHDQSGEKP